MDRGSELRAAAKAGDMKLLRALVEKGADVNAAGGEWGQVALHLAAEGGHADAVEFLLDKGASPNVREQRSREGRTPLLNAASGSSASSNECVALLLSAGADPNMDDIFGPPLSRAIRYQKSKSISRIQTILLLKAGAMVDRPDCWGFTPLLRALEGEGRRDLVKVLLRAGAAIPEGETTVERYICDEYVGVDDSLRGEHNKDAFAVLDRVKKAGGWAEFAKQHERILVGLVTKCARIPDDAARLVVGFWTPPGGS